MNVDLRIPLGALFVMLGAIMLVYGIFSDPSIYERSLGINVNTWWGAVEVLFGAVMILSAWGWRLRRK